VIFESYKSWFRQLAYRLVAAKSDWQKGQNFLQKPQKRASQPIHPGTELTSLRPFNKNRGQ
jgi:hypothetical protein